MPAGCRQGAGSMPGLHGSKCTVGTMAERMSVRELRDNLGRRIDLAHYTGEATIVERNGEPRAVLVSYASWVEQQNRPASAR
ncbi:type II toxin-antitoxin system Phd/YefM family antitoxin [Microbispora triticiradicis]|nr:type II toxin-antitoxin system Phd/YefM family antitoxin [Microbispora triticiradicis]